MAFLGRLWPGFGRVFYRVFAQDWSHVLMHTFLYAVLGFLLTGWIKPVSRRSILILYGIVFIVGCIQEGLQIWSAGAWPGWPAEILDLGVDIGGLTIALLGIWLFSSYTGKNKGLARN
ncbi:MAG TPA: VanZ family protein [Anaerolineales bacterium]|nr:VanZ family protein [Anaerolineales bacterium]